MSDDTRPPGWDDDELDRLSATLPEQTAVLGDEYAANVERIERLRASADGLTGSGEGGDGAIKVTLDAAHRIVELDVDARAVHLGSIENLREAIRAAFDGAADDVDERVAQATAELADADDWYARLPELAWLPSAQDREA